MDLEQKLMNRMNSDEVKKLQELSPAEVIALMNLTDEERQLATDWDNDPEQFEPILMNPNTDVALFQRLSSLHEKMTMEGMRIMMGDELFKELQEAEGDCCSCDGCDSGCSDSH
jgi:hypothetical protein